MLNRIFILVLIAAVAVIFGCSSAGSSNITTPVDQLPDALKGVDSSNAHRLSGFYQFTADPASGTLDIVPLRTAEMHLNALLWVEPIPFLFLTIENLEFNGNIVDVDVGLRHPFIGLDEFTGFDVCGLIITNGSVSGFNDPDLRMAGPGDVRLLNPDGYSRWWNPAEFPVNNGTMFCYQDGLLGTPDYFAHYNSTINGYKFFCDDLEADDPLTDASVEGRAKFSSGQKNTRHYNIEFGDVGLIFNYAVDACWKFPGGDYPFDLDDFPEQANRPEAYNITVTELENTLYYDDSAANGGGAMNLLIDVWDHFEIDFNQVHAESLAGIPLTSTLTPVESGEGYCRYELELSGDELTMNGDAELLITVQSEVSGYGGFLPGKPVCAYFMHTFNIGDEATAPDCSLADTPCPKWRYDLRNTGRSNYTGPTSLPVTEWAVGGESGWSAIVLPNGNFFYPDRENQEFRAINANGQIVWTVDAEGAPWNHPTVLADGTIFVATGGSGTHEPNKLFSLTQDGTVNWTKIFPSGLRESSVSINEECEIYIGDRGGKFYALDASTGEEIWSFQTGDANGEIISSPALADDGTIYFGTWINSGTSGRFWALNPDGSNKWNYKPSWGVSGSPAVGDDGTVYFGTGDSNFWALYPNGDFKWVVSIGFGVGSSPAIADDGTLYISAHYGGLYSISPSGSINWSHSLPGKGGWSGSVLDPAGNIYVGSFVGVGGDVHSGFMSAFAPNGNLLWEKALDGQPYQAAILPDNKLLVSLCHNPYTGKAGLILLQ